MTVSEPTPRVLMVCYYYPPLGGIGSQRAQKLARYLPGYGWQPVVLTPAQGSYLMDHTLDDGSAAGVEVVRTPALDLSARFKRLVPRGGSEAPAPGGRGEAIGATPGRGVVQVARNAVRTWVYIPDGQVGWYSGAVRSGLEVVRRQPVDAIFSTSFPITAHLIAARLKRATGKPWIADFRDLWTENHYAEYHSRLRKRIDQRIEQRLFAQADVLVTVSEAWAATLRRLTGGRKRVEVIRNGYDSGEFAGLGRQPTEQWTLTYVGLFYGARQDPKPVLEAIRRLIDAGRMERDKVLFNVVGQPDAYVQGLVETLGLADIARFTGFVPYREALQHQVNASLLLLILHGEQSDPGHIPGKLYEYLGSGTPILALVPPHFEAARIINDAGAGTTVTASDVDAMEAALLASYQAHQVGKAQVTNPAGLAHYERRHQAGELAALLAELKSG